MSAQVSVCHEWQHLPWLRVDGGTTECLLEVAPGEAWFASDGMVRAGHPEKADAVMAGDRVQDLGSWDLGLGLASCLLRPLRQGNAPCLRVRCHAAPAAATQTTDAYKWRNRQSLFAGD